MERLLNLLALLRARLWIVPAIMSSAGLALAYALLGPWRTWADLDGSKLWWLYSGDAGSARNLLGALLSGTMTMTSLVVSLTFVTLTLAANQLGPRLIVNFISDREIQAVIGFFLATILYLIVVLRTIGGEMRPETVPHLAITTASLLTISCMCALIFYVHKISRAIIADNVIEQVFHDLREAIETILPDKADVQTKPICSFPPVRHQVSLEHAGYVQTIDYSAIVAWADKHDVIVHVNIKAGEFVLQHGPHIEIRTLRDSPDNSVDALRNAVVIGSERSPSQDLDYSVRQLVELALRALSPGVNDPFTAIAAIDRLGAAMELILKRPTTCSEIFDISNKLRVIAVRSTAASLAGSCFDQIREAATRNTSVLIHLTDTLGKLAASCNSEAASNIIKQHLNEIDDLVPAIDRSGLEQTLVEHLDKARQSAMRGRLCALEPCVKGADHGSGAVSKPDQSGKAEGRPLSR